MRTEETGLRPPLVGIASNSPQTANPRPDRGPKEGRGGKSAVGPIRPSSQFGVPADKLPAAE